MRRALSIIPDGQAWVPEVRLCIATSALWASPRLLQGLLTDHSSSAAFSTSASPPTARPAATSASSGTGVPLTPSAGPAQRDSGQPSTSGRVAPPPLLVAEPLSRLDASHLGAYFRTQLHTLVPEAFGGTHASMQLTRDASHKRRSGCQAVKDELQFSRGGHLMYRQCVHQLTLTLAAHGSRVFAHGGPARLAVRAEAARRREAATSARAAKASSAAASAAASPTPAASASSSSEGAAGDGGAQTAGAAAAGSGETPVPEAASGATPCAAAAAASGHSRASSQGAETASAGTAALPGAGGLQLLLRGPAGCGKSVALATLVEWARASGWLVMNIGAAQSLTQGGYFMRRPDDSTTADGAPLYDTPLSAKVILKSMLDVHAARLRKMMCRAPRWEGYSLARLAKTGLNSGDDARLAVESCLALRDELLTASQHTRVLFAIDNYNSLHWGTEYGAAAVPPPRSVTAASRPAAWATAAATARRVPVTVEQLPLAEGFRMLQHTMAAGHSAAVVGAMGWSHGVSPRAEVPTACGLAGTVYVPRYSQDEVANALGYYHACGATPEAPSMRQVQQLLALTNGNGKELRELVPKMALLKLNLV